MHPHRVSIDAIQVEIAEAVRTSDQRSPQEQVELLAALLSRAFDARPVGV